MKGKSKRNQNEVERLKKSLKWLNNQIAVCEISNTMHLLKDNCCQVGCTFRCLVSSKSRERGIAEKEGALSYALSQANKVKEALETAMDAVDHWKEAWAYKVEKVSVARLRRSWK